MVSDFTLSKKAFYQKIKSKNKNSNSLVKMEALALFLEGVPLSDIARRVSRSRGTVYRWVSAGAQSLAKNSSRKRIVIDEVTGSRIIELYVLLKRPSLRRLSEELKKIFYIEKSPAQLRYFIKRSKLDQFRPSTSFDSIIRMRTYAEESE